MRYLIIGSTGDLGTAVAKQIVSTGDDVVLHGHAATERLAQLGVELGSERTIVADLRVAEEVSAMMSSLEGIDGIVNCGAVNPTAASIEEMPVEVWREILDVNLTGSFFVLKYGIPLLRGRASPSIVLVSSIFGIETPARRSAYGASKHGLAALVQAATKEEGSWLRVNAVCPGPMWSENLRNILATHADSAGMQLEDYVLTRVNDIPTGRFMELQECAEVVAFLSSPKASFIRGECVRVAGGAIQ